MLSGHGRQTHLDAVKQHAGTTTVMSETEEQLKARLGREGRKRMRPAAREAAEARERLRNKPDSPRHVTSRTSRPPSQRSALPTTRDRSSRARVLDPDR